LALADFDTTIQLKANSDFAYNGKAAIYAERKEYDLALTNYTKAISLNPNVPDYYHNRALIYKIKGQYNLALNDFNMVIGLAPHSTEDLREREKPLSLTGCKIDIHNQ